MVGATFATVTVDAQVLRSKKGIIAQGNAQVSTAQSKFGGASALFDGNTDALYITDYSGFTFTGDFTIEMFVRMTQYGEQTFLDMREGSGGVNTGAFLYRDSSSNLKFELGGSAILTDADPNILTNQWDHIAVSRSGTSIKLFVNGTETASATSSASGTPKNFYIGRNSFSATSGNTVGYLDEIRISKTARYTSAFTAPTLPFVNDDNTLLLIHANGTNATTFFEDDNGSRAPNGFSGNGTAQVDTAQSKFGGSSLLISTNNNGNYLSSSQQTRDNLNLTGDFTIEFWCRLNSNSGAFNTVMGSWAGGGSGESFYIATNAYNATGKLGISFWDTNGSKSEPNFGSALSTGVWFHAAFVRSGTTLYVFKDGTLLNAGGTTMTYGIRQTGTNFWIGNNGSSDIFDGWLDEIRISNTARYTANFTAPTSPFVNDANTVLLIHADGTDASTVFRDDNGIIGSTPKVLSPQGNTQISTAQYKFGASSAYFDGTGDYLRLGQPGNFNFGSDNWTIEGFIRPTNNLSGYKVVYNHNDNGTDRSWITIQLENSTLKSWGTTSTGSWSVYSDLSFGSLSVDTWYHFALVRDSSTMRAFLNGTQVNTASCTGWVIPAQTAAATLSAVPASYFYGWMDGIRISNTARYGASGYTTPTSAFTQDSNTLMLLNFEGANASTTFIDSAGRTQKGVSAIGNAQVSTAQSKFGGASSLYDGNGDYLQLVNSSDYNFTGNYTIEGWWYQPSNVAAGIYPTLIGTGAVSDNKGWAVTSEPTTNKVLFITSGDGSSGMQVLLTSASLSAATWNHWAVVRNNSVLTVYINGTASGSTYTTTGNSIASTYPLYIGGGIGGLSSGNFSSSSATVVNLNGYQDEIRLSNSARYTAAFTPSTTPFQNDDNTVLLLHMDGTNASTVFFDDNGAKPYTP